MLKKYNSGIVGDKRIYRCKKNRIAGCSFERIVKRMVMYDGKRRNRIARRVGLDYGRHKDKRKYSFKDKNRKDYLENDSRI